MILFIGTKEEACRLFSREFPFFGYKGFVSVRKLKSGYALIFTTNTPRYTKRLLTFKQI